MLEKKFIFKFDQDKDIGIIAINKQFRKFLFDLLHQYKKAIADFKTQRKASGRPVMDNNYFDSLKIENNCKHKFEKTSEDDTFIYTECRCGVTNCRSKKANNKHYNNDKKL